MRKHPVGALADRAFVETGTLAGQDRLYPMAASGPGQGGLARGILTFNSNPNLVFAAIQGAGIYRSIDAGAT